MESLTIEHNGYYIVMYRVITGIPVNDWYVIRVYEEPIKGYRYKSKIKSDTGIWGEVGPQKPATARDIISSVFPEFPGFTIQPAYRNVSAEKVLSVLSDFLISICIILGVEYKESFK